MLRATFSVNTPLFLGGADPKGGVVELRPPSIKGVLRFWWRAIAWSRFAGNLGHIRKEEERLFGSAGHETSGGQASFLLRARAPTPARTSPVGTVLRASNGHVVGVGARYFGYGLIEAFDSKKTGKKRGNSPARACNRPSNSSSSRSAANHPMKPSSML
jgi:CRISPR-associated protein Cmr1